MRQTYLKMHSQQTVKFGKEMREKWLRLDKAKMTIMEALDKLNDFVDDSDPDIEESPNSHHAYQTAEMLRAKYPDLDWLHLIGLVHDMGKMMCVLDKSHEQFATVGDTYVVGCTPRDSIVLRDVGFELNPDTTNSAFNSKLGMYTENCGLSSVMMTWGH
ncbi:inositol oxygenase family protein, partial [Salmonella sp. s51228]|uniref:inositol oxygenase family protein n=1 Tax=Salmonella sp. s51228 TaxID=3159652 RepID=UPI003980849E